MDDKGAIPEYDVTRGMVTDGYSAHRWLKAYQNDFAARADWCVKAYDECNHQPVVDVETADFEAQAGTTVQLKGKAYDPDGARSRATGSSTARRPSTTERARPRWTSRSMTRSRPASPSPPTPRRATCSTSCSR